jgi:hypothetical protein
MAFILVIFFVAAPMVVRMTFICVLGTLCTRIIPSVCAFITTKTKKNLTINMHLHTHQMCRRWTFTFAPRRFTSRRRTQRKLIFFCLIACCLRFFSFVCFIFVPRRFTSKRRTPRKFCYTFYVLCSILALVCSSCFKTSRLIHINTLLF